MTYSRATCYLQTLQYKKAIGDFKKVLALEPQNAIVKQQLDTTQKLLRRVEFEKVCFHSVTELYAFHPDLRHRVLGY